MQYDKRQRVPVGLRQLGDGLIHGGGIIGGSGAHKVLPQRVGHHGFLERAQEVLDAAADDVDVRLVQPRDSLAAQEPRLGRAEGREGGEIWSEAVRCSTWKLI